MKPSKLLALLSVLTVGAFVVATPAHAWKKRTSYQSGKAVACYKKVRTEPRYEYASRRVLVEAGHTYRETIPAQYAVRKRTILVEPERISYTQTPAKYVWRKKRVLVQIGRAHV